MGTWSIAHANREHGGGLKMERDHFVASSGVTESRGGGAALSRKTVQNAARHVVRFLQFLRWSRGFLTSRYCAVERAVMSSRTARVRCRLEVRQLG